MGSQRVGHSWATKHQYRWTEQGRRDRMELREGKHTWKWQGKWRKAGTKESSGIRVTFSKCWSFVRHCSMCFSCADSMGPGYTPTWQGEPMEEEVAGRHVRLTHMCICPGQKLLARLLSLWKCSESGSFLLSLWWEWLLEPKGKEFFKGDKSEFSGGWLAHHQGYIMHFYFWSTAGPLADRSKGPLTGYKSQLVTWSQSSTMNFPYGSSQTRFWHTSFFSIFLRTCECMLGCCSHIWLCNPMVYSPPGSSVHGILQVGILEWVVISFSRGSSWPRDQTPHLLRLLHCRQILYHGATWKNLKFHKIFTVKQWPESSSSVHSSWWSLKETLQGCAREPPTLLVEM